MRRYITISLLLSVFPAIHAQNGSFREQFERFQREAATTYSDFRRECNKRYADFLLKAWEWFDSNPEISKPVEQEIPPVIYDEEPTVPVIDNKVIHEEVILQPVIDEPQPVPVEPIRETPVVLPVYFAFTFYNTPLKVRAEEKHRFILKTVRERDLSQAWEQLSSSEYDNLVVDCLRIREEYRLCDWAYLSMIKTFSNSFLGAGNESTLLTAYIYSQSGYRMRLGVSNDCLYMLYGSKYEIYNTSYYTIDGSFFYPLDSEPQGGLRIANFSFPEEKDMVLSITELPKLSVSTTDYRTLSARDYPMSVKISVNKNLLDFYSGYPSSQLNGNPMTRWSMYAETPVEDHTADGLFSALRDSIQGKSRIEAAAMLLNFVQTAFVYEYDDKVWGADRAFFAEETLYYPYCDCEDRSILYSHLVRELTGLDVMLVYYPGHLCTAVRFTEPVSGDYILSDGSRYYICDPTYIGAPVGLGMPQTRNQKPTVILLEK